MYYHRTTSQAFFVCLFFSKANMHQLVLKAGKLVLISYMLLLLGLSKGNARVEISASFFFFFSVQPQFAIL